MKYTHTHTNIHTHTNTHTYTHKYTHTPTHTYTHRNTYVGGSKIFRTGATICTAVVLAPSTGRW